MNFLKFFISRTITFFLVIFIGMTAVFFLPRFMPSDPVEDMLNQITANAGGMSLEEIEAMRSVLMENFGLTGTLYEQYFAFMRRALFTFDFGPSLSMFPASVIEVIARALPWTMGLLLTATIIAWVLGNIVGLLAGFRKDKLSSKILESISIFVYPLPYYLLAIILIMLFAHIWPIFPLTTTVIGTPWTWPFIQRVLFVSVLPALSLIIIDLGWWVLSMKTISTGVAEEDYVSFAKIKGVSSNKIVWNYILPNSMLPQMTMLSLRIGTVFSGAIVAEIIFGYPGLGTLIYQSVLRADYNMIMGTLSVCILAVAFATYVIDLLYPFLDPRVRYQ